MFRERGRCHSPELNNDDGAEPVCWVCKHILGGKWYGTAYHPSRGARRRYIPEKEATSGMDGPTNQTTYHVVFSITIISSMPAGAEEDRGEWRANRIETEI